MNGEQLCYIHGFVHRSLFIKIQNGDIPKCRYLNSCKTVIKNVFYKR